MLGIEFILGQVAIEAGDTSLLGGLLESLLLWFVLVNDFCRIDVVDLVQASNSALDDFDQNESLHDRVACCADVQVSHVCLSKNSQRIAEILLNLAL